MKATQIVNDGIAEFCAVKSERLKGFGAVPMTDGGEAAKELERCVRKLGFTGVEILTNVAGKELSDPSFAPFWQKAEELGALVMIHPNGFTDASRLTRFYFNNVIGNPLETTVALHYLIFDGVLERHPRLKILAVHGGGYLGAYSGRIDHAWGARSDSHGALPQPPTTYLQRIYVDTVVFTPRQLAHWWERLARITSCSEPITPMTWRNMIRSAISPPLAVSMPRPSRHWPEAMRRSFSDCSAELDRTSHPRERSRPNQQTGSRACGTNALPPPLKRRPE
ncbi:MAG: amidohydrolase family protein [Xanthobacteraceae bacterium]